MALAVAEPDQIGVAEHDVVGAGATIHGLVEVVAHGVSIGEALQVRRVTLLHVVETECRGTLPRGFARRGVVGGEVSSLREAIGAGAYRGLNPGKQRLVAARGTFPSAVLDAAVQLLPHLVEAMHRAGGIGVVNERIAVGELERAWLQAGINTARCWLPR